MEVELFSYPVKQALSATYAAQKRLTLISPRQPGRSVLRMWLHSPDSPLVLTHFPCPFVLLDTAEMSSDQ